MKKTVYNNVNVTVVNKSTMNHCVNATQLANMKKFNFIIGNESYILSPSDVMAYIKANPKCVRYKHYDTIDEDMMSCRHASVPFYLIPDDYIISHAA